MQTTYTAHNAERHGADMHRMPKERDSITAFARDANSVIQTFKIATLGSVHLTIAIYKALVDRYALNKIHWFGTDGCFYLHVHCRIANEMNDLMPQPPRGELAATSTRVFSWIMGIFYSGFDEPDEIELKYFCIVLGVDPWEELLR